MAAPNTEPTPEANWWWLFGWSDPSFLNIQTNRTPSCPDSQTAGHKRMSCSASAWRAMFSMHVSFARRAPRFDQRGTRPTAAANAHSVGVGNLGKHRQRKGSLLSCANTAVGAFKKARGVETSARTRLSPRCFPDVSSLTTGQQHHVLLRVSSPQVAVHAGELARTSSDVTFHAAASE